MMRSLSSFDIYVIVYELQRIINYHVEKIYQISNDEIIIKIKNPENREKEILYIRNGKFICLTKRIFETPTKPSVFAMTLRKYLQNGRISEITQQDFDRIIKIKIRKAEGEYTLVIELLSQGNIVLVDPDGDIILPLIQQRWAHRTLKGREHYTPPPAQINPFELDYDEFKKIILESDADLVRTLAVKLHLSGIIAEELCVRANIEKSLKQFDEEILNKIYIELKEFLKKFINRDFKPVFVKKDAEIIDILPFSFQSYIKVSFEEIETMVSGLEIFIDKKEESKDEEKKQSEIDKIIGKLERQLHQQEESIENIKNRIKKKKLEGDLIYLHYQDCEELLKEINAIFREKDKQKLIEEIRGKPIVKTFEPTQNLLEITLLDTSGKPFDIRLDFRKSVSENAQKAYEESKKLQKKLRGAEKSVEKTKEKLRKILEDKEEVKEETEKPSMVTKKRVFWFERFRWFVSSKGNIVIGGKDAKTNEIIVRKYLKEGDRYVHADIQGAPSCIVKQIGVDDTFIPITEETLREACVFASCYSKAWKQFMEAQAYWVHPEQVSKTPQSGEFVPKGAFIIRGKRNYCKCKLELAIGVVKILDTEKIMAAPIDAIARYTNRYIIIQPGNIEKNKIARKISSMLHVPLDDILKVLPPGGCNIIKTVGLEEGIA